MRESYDVIVAGLGAMGSATAYHLAKKNKRVLGLDRFAPGHTFGSSHGRSRIIRESYFEDPLFVPFVQRSYDLWEELERESGRALLRVTGGLMIGSRDGTLVSGAFESAVSHRIPHEVLSAREIHARFPAFHVADDHVAVWDARAGYLDADSCNSVHRALAEQSGAQFRFDEQVLSWAPDGAGVRVTTSRTSYLASQLVLNLGPWMTTALTALELPLTVERQVLAWFVPQDSRLYEPERCPVFLWEYNGGQLAYGFPLLDGAVKAAVFHSGDRVENPDIVRRDITSAEIDAVREALHHVLPDAAQGALHHSQTCLFTNTPDARFVIDWHPGHPNVLISSPCSGHGFKFASAIGELQANLLVGREPGFDLGPFALARFGSPAGGGSRH